MNMGWNQVWIIIIVNLLVSFVFYIDPFGLKNKNTIPQKKDWIYTYLDYQKNDKTKDYIKLKSIKSFIENIDLDDHMKEKISKCIQSEIDYCEHKIKHNLGEEEMKKMGLKE